MERRIIYNAIKCNSCGELIESEHRHDFKRCSCMSTAVDGGLRYLRRIGTNYTEMYLLDTGKHSDRRKYLKWGNNYDKNMKLLSETKWIPIKDLDTNHIYKILELESLNSFYRSVLEDEIIERENQILKKYEMDN